MVVRGEVAAGAVARGAVGLPRLPGVYRFRDEAGALLYVGTSRDLGRRVASYFEAHHAPASKEGRIARLAARVEWDAVPSAVEALVLEGRTIQCERPYFNRRMKDVGRLAYVRFDERDPFPRFEVARHLEAGPWRYLGPFPGSRALATALERLADALGLRTCAGQLDPDPGGRACLRLDLGQCDAPCLARVTPGVYGRQLARALVALGGGEPEVARALGARAGVPRATLPRPVTAALRALRARRLWGAIVAVVPVIGAPGHRLLAIGGGRLLSAVASPSSSTLPAAFARTLRALDPPPAVLVPREALDEVRLLTGWLASAEGRAASIDLARLGRERAWTEVLKRVSPGELFAIRDATSVVR
jgi:hypothetical protein